MPRKPRRIKKVMQPKDKVAAAARKPGKGVKTTGPAARKRRR